MKGKAVIKRVMQVLLGTESGMIRHHIALPLYHALKSRLGRNEFIN